MGHLVAILLLVPASSAQTSRELAERLSRANLPAAASIHAARVLELSKGGPSELKAVEEAVKLQEQLKDPYLLPTLLAKSRGAAWNQLPKPVLGKVNYLVATTLQRGLKLEQARSLLLGVPAESPAYAKARYLLGVIDVDPRLPGGPRDPEALQAFEEVLQLRDSAQDDLRATQELALLGEGRLFYGRSEYAKAVSAYERVPRFSRHWDQALFENAFARFRNGDSGGALGSLQSLHAPQFEGAFQPESWVLKATIYHFVCLFDESKASFKAFEDLYMPMADKIRPLTEASGDDYAPYLQRVTEGSHEIPQPILLWIRRNERIRGMLDLLAQMDREQAQVDRVLAGQSATAAELKSDLAENRKLLAQVAGKLVKNRLAEAYQMIRKLHSDGDLIRLETTLKEKQLLELGIDQKKLLADQKLNRPPIPSEAWNYWQFQGEFWFDEIGYYQYTLKRGCPEEASH